MRDTGWDPKANTAKLNAVHDNGRDWRINLPSAQALSYGLKPAPLICYGCYFSLAVLIIGFIFFPYKTGGLLAGFIGIFGAIIGLMRLAATFTPLTSAHSLKNINAKALNIWPHYTVLVPLYKEDRVVPKLMQSLSALDYPQDRLEIMMVCEADDLETIAAVQKRLTAPFKLIAVPPSLPRTKPKALNMALQQARGEIVTIYDAEDHPHPQQLKIAARRLMNDSRLGAVQAPLDYYNISVNWLTRQFTLEYAFLFRVWLPFLTRLGLPFPLGGTSNHIRREALDAIGGWDAYNVTEDADLSFRLAALGYQIGYIPAPTQEEAVESWQAWQYQRARWMKGFLQTWLVHMSRPFLPGGMIGALRFFTVQITIGSALMAGLIHVPFMIYLCGVTALRFAGYDLPSPSPWVWAGLALCYGAGMVSGGLAAWRLGQRHLLWHVPLMPLYWWLLFPATLQAIWEFLCAPFHWNKTEHGLTEPSEDVTGKTIHANVRGFTS